jgi:hypothetical protein
MYTPDEIKRTKGGEGKPSVSYHTVVDVKIYINIQGFSTPIFEKMRQL